jgi:phosphatidylinositol glycan class W
MAKTYKQMKEAWVSGHTGSSVADVNSVSLAMPVQYTLPLLEQCALANHHYS